MTGNRVTGHGLVAEGAAHEIGESGQPLRVRWNSVSGVGRAVCSCGAISDTLRSAHQRKKWHREHKTGVTA